MFVITISSDEKNEKFFSKCVRKIVHDNVKYVFCESKPIGKQFILRCSFVGEQKKGFLGKIVYSRHIENIDFSHPMILLALTDNRNDDQLFWC